MAPVPALVHGAKAPLQSMARKRLFGPWRESAASGHGANCALPASGQRRTAAASKSHDQAHHEQDEEDEEQHLGNAGRSRSNAAEPEYRRDDGDDKENQ